MSAAHQMLSVDAERRGSAATCFSTQPPTPTIIGRETAGEPAPAKFDDRLTTYHWNVLDLFFHLKARGCKKERQEGKAARITLEQILFFKNC